MNTLYLCPSGISLFEYLKREKADLSGSVIKSLERYFDNADDNLLMKASAEINSLFRKGVANGDKIVFFCSDTEVGENVAEYLKRIINKRKGCETRVKRIAGLQTDNKEKFDTEGITNLTEAILSEVDANRWLFSISLNATAGFKAAVPYLTFIGMIFHLPIFYLFEQSENIIELPPIPIEFDLARLKQLEPVIEYILDDFITVDEFRSKTGFSYEDLMLALNDILLLEEGHVRMRPTGRILYRKYLQVKGNKVFISAGVNKKLASGAFDRTLFEELFNKMRDPVHLQSKLHNEVKKKGRIDLDCYKVSAGNERIFFFSEKNKIYICDIYMHDEYEKILATGTLLRADFEKENKTFKEVLL